MATVLPVIALAAALGAACSKSDSPAEAKSAESPAPTQPTPPAVSPTPTEPPIEPSSMNTDKLKLTWSATPSAKSLAISYKIENTGSSPVFVASKLVHGGANVDRLVVMNGTDAIRLVRGLVMPDAERVTGVPMPIFVELPAGQSLDAKVELPLPLEAWHNAGKMMPLRAAKKIVLEVAVAETEKSPPKWLVGTPLPAP